MEERKIRGRSRRRKRKNQMRRPMAVLLALMLSVSSFGTATVYADDAIEVNVSAESGEQKTTDPETWTEKSVLEKNEISNSSGKENDGKENSANENIGNENAVNQNASSEKSGGSSQENSASEGEKAGEISENEQNAVSNPEEKQENPEAVNPRPSQSDTVEVVPGAPGASEKEDTPETGSENASGETKADAETKTEEKTETEVTIPDAPSEKNYDYIYDKESGKFKVTFNIKEEAKGDQTIELSKVIEEINTAGKKQFEQWFQTEEGANALDDAQYYGTTIRQTFGGVEYVYNAKTDTARLYQEPGCTVLFDVYITNGSKHTYVYKNNSFIISTPDMSNSDQTGVTGFDGQELPEDYTKGFLSPKYDSENAGTTGVIENLIDEALKDTKSQWQYGIDKDGNLTTSHSQNLTKADIPIGTPVYKIGSKYYLYSEKYDCYYADFSSSQVEEKPKGSGQYVVKSVPSSGKKNNAFKLDGNNRLSSYYSPYVRGSEINSIKASPARMQDALNKYLKKNNTTLENEVLKYYNEKDKTNYGSIEELLSNNPDAMAELTKSGEQDNSHLSTLNPMQLISSSQYDNFYQNIFSFNVGSQEEMEKFLEENSGHGHGHGSWASDGANLTIGDYMADKLNETEGAWDKANAYFHALLDSGLTAQEATWVAFSMATNIDGPRADNNYQNTAWNWYSSLVLKQQDGTFNLTKVDTEGNQLGDDEGEGQTSFYLWYTDTKTETDEQGNQKTVDVTKYCVYVDPVYETVQNEDGTESKKLVKDGYYGWVEYDPDNKELNYTITTTNGTLNIDYALLEGVVYYLQEKAAPEGYDADPNIYVICDEDAYKQMMSEKGVKSVINPATGVESAAVYMGAIKGGETLKVNFVNGRTAPNPTPDPTPTPDNGGGGGGSHGGHGGGGSSSGGKKQTTSVGPGTIPEEPVLPEQPLEVPIENIPAQGLPKTGDSSTNTSALMLTMGLIAAAYVWMSGNKKVKKENE